MTYPQLTELYQEQMFEYKEETKRPGVLATVSGPGFFPGIPSRNHRMYPDEAWTKALSNPYTQRLLENSLMFGTVGHQDMEFDELISKQMVSHVTRKLQMESKSGKKIGMIEADILDTPVGRILNTLLRAGCKMAVSSKSYGEYKGRDEAGNSIVDPDKFFCQRFDFVVDPGFLDAMPQLKEDFEALLTGTQNNITEGNPMDEKLYTLMTEKADLATQLNAVLKDNEALKAQIADAPKKAMVEGLESEVTTLKTSLSEAQETIKAFEAVGKIEDLKAMVDNSGKLTQQLETFGGIPNITKIFEEHKAYADLGETPAEIKDTLDKIKVVVEKLEPLGTCETIQDALEAARDSLKEYRALGLPAQIKAFFEKAKKLMDGISEKTVKTQVDELVRTYGIKEEKATELLKKMTVDEAKELLGSLVESADITQRYGSGRKVEKKGEKESEGEPLLEGDRSTRLLSRFRGKGMGENAKTVMIDGKEYAITPTEEPHK